ncbi:hypothetical protein Tco_1280618, partial [Tanacetum coccineum]
DGISLIASQIGKPIMLDSFTSSTCIDSWGRSSFARCLIEVKADEKPPRCEQGKIFGHVNDQCLKTTTAIPTVFMNNYGFQTVVNKRKSGKTGSTVGKAIWQPIKPKVRFEPKPHGNSQKNEASNVSTSANDGPNFVHSSFKEKPGKAVDIPSSSYTRGFAKREDLQFPTSSSNILTLNPYDALDDMKSEEEVEVVSDETVNFLKCNITGANIQTALEASKT